MSAAFGDDDLARLEALLSQGPHAERALRPDGVHGLLNALAIGPDPFPADEQWIAVALDAEPEAHATHDPELVQLLARFATQTREAIAAGTAQPLLYTLRRGRADYRSWCEGFLIGVAAAESDWFSYGEPGDVEDLMGPIELIAEAGAPAGRGRLSPEQWRKRLLDAEAQLPATLERLRAFWAIVREPPATVRREGGKVGRNDPCPCGSGRKFKQCHGKG